jgi:hypothetical protein
MIPPDTTTEIIENNATDFMFSTDVVKNRNHYLNCYYLSNFLIFLSECVYYDFVKTKRFKF